MAPMVIRVISSRRTAAEKITRCTDLRGVPASLHWTAANHRGTAAQYRRHRIGTRDGRRPVGVPAG
ncbi:hypothetical protein, partial [Saccharopolyspora montiporae]|uniref:hypothetical protein n=1 Tax=Saccharopolyspora montiporae TaxID=2781240 RepID=UPI001D13A9F4